MLGVWNFYLADFTGSVGFAMVALAMVLMFTYNFIIGGVFGPRTAGVALEEI